MDDIAATCQLRLHGWHWSASQCRDHIGCGKLLHLLAETGNVCDQDCEYCYTVQETLAAGQRPHARQLSGELTLKERVQLIADAAALGAQSYDVVGAGEPLIDRLVWAQLEAAHKHGLIPIVFTNGSVLGHPTAGPRVAQRLQELDASVVVKWHGANHALHDDIVRRPGAAAARDRALNLLMEWGFNNTTPTRLGIDNIIYSRTAAEIPDCLRFCRQHNLFLVCSTFIPQGRTRKGHEEELALPQVAALFEQCRQIDAAEFGIHHSGRMPYIGYGQTCTQYMGLYVTIQGDSFGCVGRSESYGNIRTRPLAAMWQERLPLLMDYDGGCPPRQQFYQSRFAADELLSRFSEPG